MNERRKDDAMNIPREHDERSTDHGIRMYGVITLGNILSGLLSGLLMIIPVVIWGTRLESRVDSEARRLDARIDTQKQIVDLSQRRIDDSLVEATKRAERIEALLEGMGRDVTAVRIRLGVLKVDEPSTQPFQRK
ncbi:MAG: hypothetical protein RL328_2640 [Acidobacteriota bacterium]|jgi:hypothetical protein